MPRATRSTNVATERERDASDSEQERDASGFVTQVARGFVYLFLLNSSVGAAVTAIVSVLNVYAGSLVTGPGTILSLGLAAVFTHMEEPPRIIPLAVFGFGSFAVSAFLNAVLAGPEASAAASVAPWLAGPAVAFMLVYLVGWEPISAYARPG